MKSTYLQKNVFLFFLLSMFGCISFQFENDMVMGDFNGKVKAIKKYNLNDTIFPGNIIEHSKYDQLSRLIYKGYSEISSPDSILRYITYSYGKNFEEIQHYEGSLLEQKEYLIKKKHDVTHILEQQNKRDTGYLHQIDDNGKTLMYGEYRNKGKYEAYKKYKRDGKITEGGNIEYSADSSIKKVPMFYFTYNSDGCIVKTEHSKDSYTTYFKSDRYCNVEEVYGVDDKGVVKDRDVFVNILDHHNNWIKRYCLNSKNDTLYIQVREIEYYK